MKKLNILRVVYDWPPPWNGLAPAPYYLSKSQGKLGHTVKVLTGLLGGKRLLKFDFSSNPEKNVYVTYLPRALTKHTGPFLTTSPCVLFNYLFKRFTGQKIDVVHGHGHTMLWFNIYKLLFGRFDKIPYVVHFHIVAKERKEKAIEKGEKMKFMQKYFENPLWELADRTSVKVADACIFVSKSNLEKMYEFYKPERDKLYVVESGYEPQIFSIKDNSTEMVERPKGIEILCVGKIIPRKGPDVLIEALKYLPSEYYLRWIGTPEDDSYVNELKDMAINIGVEHRIIWQGYVKNVELAKFYKNADIYAMPSQAEGLPKVVVEALGSGLPVIADGFETQSKIKGLRYFSSRAPKTVANEIKEFYESKPVVNVARIAKMFSWESRAKEIDAIYEKIL